MSEANRQKMEAAIVADPSRAPLLRGTGGVRKLRWAGSGRGKQGGIRAIYFHHAGPEAIYMLTAYAKADRAAALGLPENPPLDEVVRQYIEDYVDR